MCGEDFFFPFVFYVREDFSSLSVLHMLPKSAFLETVFKLPIVFLIELDCFLYMQML